MILTVYTASQLDLKGTFDGYGKRWWGLPGIGYLVRGETRPRLFTMDYSNETLIENVLFLNSPYWTTYFTDVNGLEIRHSAIDARRMDDDGHNLIDMTAFNTDGFDVTGTNVWIREFGQTQPKPNQHTISPRPVPPRTYPRHTFLLTRRLRHLEPGRLHRS